MLIDLDSRDDSIVIYGQGKIESGSRVSDISIQLQESNCSPHSLHHRPIFHHNLLAISLTDDGIELSHVLHHLLSALLDRAIDPSLS
jgi:hypothetical protein